MIVATLTGEYPRATDTFIQREVAGLRALGLDVRTFTIRRTAAAHHVGPEQRAEAARTVAVLERALRPGSLRAHLAALRRAPGAWARSLRDAWRTAPPGARGFLYNLAYFHEAVTLAALLREARVRHLHVHIAMGACTVGRLAAPIAGIPWSFTLHGPDDLDEPRRWRLDDKIAASAFVACISSYARSQAMRHSPPAMWPKLHVVHCGVEPARYAGPRAPVPGRLLFVGRLAAVKGLPVLLDALALARAVRPDLTLAVVGDGPERAAVEAADGVAVLGYRSQDEVAALLATAEVLVLPSLAEGVPVVLMEAMAAGVPVVATRVAGIPELVEDGASGRLVPPGEADALAAAILDVLKRPESGSAMGEAGRAWVFAEFDSRTEAARLARLIRWAVGGGERPARRPDPWAP